MPGPPPKPPGTRRRRNKGPSARNLGAAPPSRARPSPPELPGAENPLPETRAWWETVWTSPMAAVYLDADVPALARLATLVDRLHRGDAGARLLAEIRSLEDRYGLSPLARRRLQWEVERAGGESSGEPNRDE